MRLYRVQNQERNLRTARGRNKGHIQNKSTSQEAKSPFILKLTSQSPKHGNYSFKHTVNRITESICKSKRATTNQNSNKTFKENHSWGNYRLNI